MGKWLFGHITYDYGKTLFGIPPFSKSDTLKHPFPLLTFFEADIVLAFKDDFIEIYSQREPSEIILEIGNHPVITDNGSFKENFNPDVEMCISKKEYVSIINSIQNEIVLGNCYEINFCFDNNYSCDSLKDVKHIPTFTESFPHALVCIL